MADIALGSTGVLESLTLTPSFKNQAGRAELLIPDQRFPEIKGTVRVLSGPNAAARAFGDAAMGLRARCVIRGSGFAVGFKQVATLRFHVAHFAGLKDSDGSIVESSTGLNFLPLLDCAVDAQMRASTAPFYSGRQLAKSGVPLEFDMIDQPAAKLRLQRRNHKRDRLNFLVAFSSSCEFVTFVVVERPDGVHQVIRGHEWSCTQELAIRWKKGQPVIEQHTGGVRDGGGIGDLAAGDPRMKIMANAGLGDADTMVARMNTAIGTVSLGGRSGDYEVTEFPDYNPLLSGAMRGRIEGTMA